MKVNGDLLHLVVNGGTAAKPTSWTNLILEALMMRCGDTDHKNHDC